MSYASDLKKKYPNTKYPEKHRKAANNYMKNKIENGLCYRCGDPAVVIMYSSEGEIFKVRTIRECKFHLLRRTP